jgi:ATP-dependent Lon protease
MSDQLSLTSQTLPLLPLRDVVVFPHMVIPLFVGRPKSIKALEAAMEVGKSIMLVAQKNASKDEPCVRHLRDRLRLQHPSDAEAARRHREGAVEGSQRARISEIDDTESHFTCDLTPIETTGEGSPEIEALRRAILAQFDQYVKLNKKIPPEILRRSTASMTPVGWPTPSLRTCRSRSSRSRASSRHQRSASVSRSCSRRSRPSSTSCRSRSASAAASSGRWRRASASTT